MHIRNNIINYLQDNDYVICFYDNKVYFYRYGYIKKISEDVIVIEINDSLSISIKGEMLSINKITKEELSINGMISSIEKNEKK